MINLVIKPTAQCDFRCTYCATFDMDVKHFTKVPDQIKEVIQTVKPSVIIVAGGEPLMCGPLFYYELLELTEEMKTPISITSNLKSFYNHPDRWVELFKHERFSVATSFQYGGTRMYNDTTPFTEEMFIEFYALYQKLIGKDMPFIATFDESNEDTVLDVIRLAKRLKTYCRIGNVLALGKADKTFPRYKIFQMYIKIIEAGLRDYEIFTSGKDSTGCGINSNFLCKSTIRHCHIDNSGKLHYAFCDNSSIEIPMDYKDDIKKSPLPKICMPTHVVNNDCYGCELFGLCNGCENQCIQYPEEHCREMLKIKDKLIEYGLVYDMK